MADSLHGGDYSLRRMLEERGQPYVLAVCSNHHLRFLTREGLVTADPKTIADELPAQEWAMLAAGEGAKGLRLYNWAHLQLPWITDEGFERWLLIRRIEPCHGRTGLPSKAFRRT